MAIIKNYQEISPEVLQDWKARHGDRLQELSIETDGGIVARFVVKPPSRTVVDLVGQHGQSKRLVEANKVLTANCILGGDLDLLENDGAVYAAVIEHLGSMLRKKAVTVKKL
jgi:hypothetical protein